MIDYTLLVPSSPNKTPLLNNLIRSYEKYKNDFTPQPMIFGSETRTSCYQSKMLNMREVLKTLSSEYVVVIDGFDLIFNKELDESLFDDFKDNSELEFMFGAEMNCFPYPQYSSLFEDNARTKIQYLNGGVIIAKRDNYLQELELRLDPQKYDQQEYMLKSDQVPYTLMYKESLERGDGKVKIDCEARISLQMFQLEKDKDYILNEDKQVTYSETGNIPFFAHFNGDGKDQMHHFGIEYGN